MPPFATVLPGATSLQEGNANPIFRGQVLLADESVRGAILKDLGPRQLANELLVSALALQAGLPTPDAYLALVRGKDLPVFHGPTLPDGNRLVFASADVKVPNLAFQARGTTTENRQRLMDGILEWAGLGSLYGFDAWVANVDRHAGNLLFGGKEQVWLIDHGHCLSGPTWTPDDLKEDGNYRNRLTEWLTSRMNLVQKKKRLGEANKLAVGLASINVDDSMSASHVRALLPPTHVAAASAFLKARIDKVPRHASKALGVPVLL